MKIHIIGGPGSGKTFIAQHLAEDYQIPALDLDEVFWNHEKQHYGARAEPEKRDAALEAFIRNDNWIVEGVFYRWLIPSFQAADWIFILTPPRWLRQVRVVRRFVRRKLRMERGKKETLRGLVELLVWGHKFDRDNLTRAIAMLSELALPVTRCSTLAEVVNHLKRSPSNAPQLTR